eukprot:SAG22_NODE_881_length_6693_cov_15.416288_1_plen_102_part_00
MNKELIREKLTNTIELTDSLNKLLSVDTKIEFESYKRREEIDKISTKIKMNTLGCLIQLSETDDLSELSHDEQELYYEYESDGEKEPIKFGVTTDGFHYLK